MKIDGGYISIATERVVGWVEGRGAVGIDEELNRKVCFRDREMFCQIGLLLECWPCPLLALSRTSVQR